MKKLLVILAVISSVLVMSSQAAALNYGDREISRERIKAVMVKINKDKENLIAKARQRIKAQAKNGQLKPKKVKNRVKRILAKISDHKGRSCKVKQPHKVPEMDASNAALAFALIGGVLLIAGERRARIFSN